ncbi:VIT1/CCC1 transporter family protein [Phaeocystidibacter luteus]|uniref:Iron transporter n=1 Tax=Phaeocystidibacter luteus TaxID=911197 RepID=A0A6N6RJP1_9FLAO|nr:VIT1/CCC1 transporter family protein [Phaeocystidibacter luteus]KAB2813937.1 iron transporter [Phaeocystidibacter luteus]
MSHHDHKEEHFQGSQAVRDIVIGMADGLTVPFALTAGLSGAIDSNTIIITAGMAEIVAGSIAMGLGGYLAGTTEYEHYHSERKREYWEVDHLPEKEKEEIREIMEEYGISKELSQSVAEDLAKDKDKWVDFMMRFELELEEPHLHQAKRSAGNIAGAYIAGGFVPLAGYFITDTPEDGLIYSSIFTVFALFTFGYVKSKLTGQKPLKGALKTTLVGVIASAAAYGIALWIA